VPRPLCFNLHPQPEFIQPGSSDGSDRPSDKIVSGPEPSTMQSSDIADLPRSGPTPPITTRCRCVPQDQHLRQPQNLVRLTTGLHRGEAVVSMTANETTAPEQNRARHERGDALLLPDRQATMPGPQAGTRGRPWMRRPLCCSAPEDADRIAVDLVEQLVDPPSRAEQRMAFPTTRVPVVVGRPEPIRTRIPKPRHPGPLRAVILSPRRSP
jgi:hypothetical protein